MIKNVRQSAILKYKNPDVVDRFVKDYNVSTKEAEVIFEDCLIFLWLTNRYNYLSIQKSKMNQNLEGFAMLESWKIIDEMWHTFVIFTRDYTDFSLKYFGHYLHHQPATKDSVNVLSESYFDFFVEFVAREIGRDRFNRWFIKYPKKYPLENFKRREVKRNSK